MFSIHMDLFRIKLHYFLYFGGIAPVVGFASTIAKQWGYSPTIVGSLFTYLSVLAILIKPLVGIIVDKYPVKKFVFLTFILASGLTAFALNYVHKLPVKASVNLNCDETTSLDFCSKSDGRLPKCDDTLFDMINNYSEPVKCQLLCERNEFLWSEICKFWYFTDYCVTQNNTFLGSGHGYFNVSLFINTTNQVNDTITYQVESVQTTKNYVSFPTCQNLAITRCEINCSNSAIIKLANVSNFKGNIFALYQFREFFIVMSLFWLSQSAIWSLQDPICFDILGDKPGDFGKQKCWGSISWGLFSIIGGVLVDYCSVDKYQKNYTPIFYLCLALLLCNFALVSQIKVTETSGSKNTFSVLFKLFTKLNVAIYCVWIIFIGIGTSIIWSYLFWYMEDITMKYHSDKQSWIKTLQGLALGIQCIGSEMPISFFSGWIIKRLGYWHCMSLGLFVFGVRFYLYSIITNPIWILPVELMHGIAFGLSNIVLVAYARHIAPPSAATSVLTISSALFEGVGASFGNLLCGLLYEKYGGVWMFHLFSYSSLLLSIFLIIFTKYHNL